MGEKVKDYSWLWIILIIIGIYILAQFNKKEPCEGPCCNVPAEDLADCYEVMSEPDWRADEYDNSTDKANLNQNYAASDSYSGSSTNNSACPNGCTTHKTGCDIKGNIGFNSGEKIYHLPVDEYYSETKIDPSYGERWFCTEEEAKANGWRRTRE